MSNLDQMRKFVEPESVALFGVSSQRVGENARNILQNLLDCGYRGKLYPVNPNAAEILGVKAFPRIADVPAPVDLAVINLPRSLVPGVVQEFVQHGIRSIIIATQGFADAHDEEGRNLQKQLDELVRQSGARIVGPNSLGTANAFINFSSSYANLEMQKVPVGVVCQTGAFLFRFGEAVFVGKAIDLGNACDVSFADALEYFAQDDQVKVVALHIEGVRDGRSFIEAASRATRIKPVVALKTGGSPYAAGPVQSHTGSLVGRDEVWQAAFKKSGVIRVSDIDEFGDAVRAFSTLPPMRGGRVAFASISGGLGIVGIDACHRYGLQIARFSDRTMGQIAALCPVWQGVGNPADIWPAFIVQKQPLGKLLTESMSAVLSDPGVNALVLIWNVLLRHTATQLGEVVPQIARAFPHKPVVCSLFGAYAEEAMKELGKHDGIMATYTPERAVRALGLLHRYYSVHEG